MTAIPPPTWDALMRRYFGEIERNLDAAELLCRKGHPKKCPACAFRNLDRTGDCCLSDIRSGKGERIPPGEPVQEIGRCVHGTRKNDVIICGETFGACKHQEFYSSVPLILHCRRGAGEQSRRSVKEA